MLKLQLPIKAIYQRYKIITRRELIVYFKLLLIANLMVINFWLKIVKKSVVYLMSNKDALNELKISSNKIYEKYKKKSKIQKLTGN